MHGEPHRPRSGSPGGCGEGDQPGSAQGEDLGVDGWAYGPGVPEGQAYAHRVPGAPTGDYNVAVIADKEGRYTVRAQAFPALATLPVVGGPLPPLAESPSPPNVVGDLENGAVMVDGRRVPPPPPTQVEIRAPSNNRSFFDT